MKKCVLYERECINCHECEMCDINPSKKCDNCGKCLETDGSDYKEIMIDEILFEKDYEE